METENSEGFSKMTNAVNIAVALSKLILFTTLQMHYMLILQLIEGKKQGNPCVINFSVLYLITFI